jgi:two-component sensor histidine kinase/CHASE3 domain sensor protein
MSAHARPRGRFSFVRMPILATRMRTATTTVIAIGVVGVSVIVAAWINQQALETAARVSHSIEVRERAERFLGHLRDAETGQRGYILTGVDIYLRPFTSGRAAALPELDTLENLVSDDPQQKERVAKARADTNLKIAELDSTIALAGSGRQSEAASRVREGRGVATMDAIRATVQQIQLAENMRLVDLNRSEERRRLMASSGIVVALAGLAFAAWQQLRIRQQRAAQLTLSNASLERMVGERTQQLERERIRIEALLRDVSHRVGNNLAMVSALLNVQIRQNRDPAVRDALGQAQSRIQAIAAGQRRLRLDIETDEIDARPYMEDLLAEIGKATEGRPIAIDLVMDAIRLPGRDAVSFVVIVNELVTNAIKHAFPDNAPGRIVIAFAETMQEDGGEALSLSVTDDGIGLPETAQSKGLGQTVIASLMRSMRATMVQEAVKPGSDRPGSRITLTFPRRDQSA